jgi:hypothetical protein
MEYCAVLNSQVLKTIRIIPRQFCLLSILHYGEQSVLRPSWEFKPFLFSLNINENPFDPVRNVSSRLSKIGDAEAPFRHVPEPSNTHFWRNLNITELPGVNRFYGNVQPMTILLSDGQFQECRDVVCYDVR